MVEVGDVISNINRAESESGIVPKNCVYNIIMIILDIRCQGNVRFSRPVLKKYALQPDRYITHESVATY